MYVCVHVYLYVRMCTCIPVCTYVFIQVTFRFRTYFMNLPRNKLRVVVNVVEKLVLDGAIPTRILMLVRDLIAFRIKINVATKADNSERERVLIKTT